MATMTFTGPDEVSLYAFVMLRRATIFRLKHGRSMLRNKECLMAQNHGWSTQKRFGQKLLDDLNKIAEEAGLELND